LFAEYHAECGALSLFPGFRRVFSLYTPENTTTTIIPMERFFLNSSRIHGRTISLMFLSIILRFLGLEISINYVYIANQFQTSFAQGGVGGVKSVSRPRMARRKTLKTFVPITSKNSASGAFSVHAPNAEL
jgi:hypothetical protein